MKSLWRTRKDFQQKRDAALCTPEVQARKAESMSAAWARDGYKEKVGAAIASALPASREKRSAAIRALWQTEHRAAMQAHMRRLWKTDAYKEKLLPQVTARFKEQATLNWTNPERRAKMLKHLRALGPATSARQAGKVPDVFSKCAYIRPDGTAVDMRSRWECAYAAHLDRLHILWKYEPRAFRVGEGPWIGKSYAPDFYLLDFDMYVEIKGPWLNGAYAKIMTFRRLYPSIKLKVFLEAELREKGIIN